MKSRRDVKAVLEGRRHPCLLQGNFSPDLDSSIFTPGKLQHLLSKKNLKFRCGKRNFTNLQWEGGCSFCEARLADIVSWDSISDCEDVGDSQKILQKQLNACCNKHVWLYADYMYMKDVFCDHPEVLKFLNWDGLGFSGKSGLDSTMWIGTAGAYTLCHYDTYGCNIVLQVSGSKKWTLFPPSDTEYLYPTRIPYEESSVFSEVNINHPDYEKHPKFISASPHIVTLKAGDILYVPNHWWHFVENLELSVSINLWYEVESDSKSRLNEAITRSLIGTCCHIPSSGVQWLNPNEDMESVKSIDENMQYIRQSIGEVQRSNRRPKRRELVSQGQNHGFTVRPILPENTVKSSDVENSGRADCAVWLPKKKSKTSSVEEAGNSFSYANFVQCLTQPSVIDAISDAISKRYFENDESC